MQVTRDSQSAEAFACGPLLLSSRDGSHSGPSGYSTLSNYLPEAEFLDVFRQSPRNVFTRFCTAVNRRLTLVSWAWGSSLLLEWKALRRLVKDPRRIVHYLWADRDMAYLDLLKKRLGFKVVGTFHNCPDQMGNLFNFRSRLSSIDHFIVVSSCQVEVLEKKGVPREKISVVLHGVDTRHFRPGQERNGGKFRVLSIGTWRRDTACMEKIFRHLAEEPDIESVCLVQRKWRDRWKGISNLHLPDRVTDEELLRLYQTSDVLLMAANAATANNALVEALACGVPVIGSDVGGIREYTTDKAGLFFAAGDAAGAIEQIKKIKCSLELAAELSRGARRRGEELDWSLVAEQTHECYQKVGELK